MPTNVVKTPRDERLWERAKAVVRREYGTQKKLGRERFYRLAMGVYQREKGKK